MGGGRGRGQGFAARSRSRRAAGCPGRQHRKRPPGSRPGAAGPRRDARVSSLASPEPSRIGNALLRADLFRPHGLRLLPARSLCSSTGKETEHRVWTRMRIRPLERRGNFRRTRNRRVSSDQRREAVQTRNPPRTRVSAVHSGTGKPFENRNNSATGSRLNGFERMMVAETKGFEPSRRFPAYSLSRGAPSTTRPRLRHRTYQRGREGFKAKPCGIGKQALAARGGRGMGARPDPG